MSSIEIEDESKNITQSLSDSPISLDQQLNHLNSPKKVSTKIIKRKRSKRAKVIPYTLIFKNNLKFDGEPVFIFYFRKIMKSYETEEFNRYRNYGLTDAGVGRIEQIILNKISQSIELTLKTYSFGILDFSYLIDLYKSYQDQQYYQLALAIEQYQQWSIEKDQELKEIFKRHYLTSYHQEEIDNAYSLFQEDVQQYINDHLSNEIYEVLLGTTSIELKMPVLKKKIFSKEYLNFLGGDSNSIFQKLQQQSMKESFFYLLNGDNFDGRLQLTKMTKLIQQLIKGTKSFDLNDEIITLEGLVIPTVKTVTMIYYDYKTRQFTQEPQFYYINIINYTFDIHWIKYLMQVRSLNNLFSKSLMSHSQTEIFHQPYLNDNLISNFDFACQQEYFLEKFQYI